MNKNRHTLPLFSASNICHGARVDLILNKTTRTGTGETLRVRRFDRAALPVEKAAFDENGFLLAPALIARTGIYTYSDPITGETWNELREAADVFDPEVLASFELLPVTNGHPDSPETGNAVTPENARVYQCGSVGNVRRSEAEPDYVAAVLRITDRQAIADAKAGKVELSCGYWCDREPAPPGAMFTDPSGALVPYKFVQRNSRGNHLALVDFGRAGPMAALKLDRNDAIAIKGGTPAKGSQMKIVINGIETEVSDTAAQLFAAHEKATQVKIDQLTARLDAAEASAKKLTADAADAGKRFDAAVSERVALVEAAGKRGVKIDGLSNDEARRAIVQKMQPDLKLDGKSAAYVEALFDLQSSQNPVTAQIDQLTTDARANAGKVETDGGELSAQEKSEAAYRAANKNAGKAARQ